MKTYRQCCTDYYRSSIPGRGGQDGAGPVMLSRYRPMVGHGLFGSVFKSVVPFLKNRLLPAGIKGIAGVANDLISGRPFGESIKSRGSQALKTIFKPAARRQAPRKSPAARSRGGKRSKASKVQKGGNKRRRRQNAFGI